MHVLKLLKNPKKCSKHFKEISLIPLIYTGKKITEKQSSYRPGVAQMVPGS